MKRSKLIQSDGIAHTRKNPSGIKGKIYDGYHNGIPQEEIDICLNCDKPKCSPNYCKKLTNICKNCKHLMFSDCYGECSMGYIDGIVKPYDSCKHFEKRRK